MLLVNVRIQIYVSHQQCIQINSHEDAHLQGYSFLKSHGTSEKSISANTTFSHLYSLIGAFPLTNLDIDTYKPTYICISLFARKCQYEFSRKKSSKKMFYKIQNSYSHFLRTWYRFCYHIPFYSHIQTFIGSNW